MGRPALGVVGGMMWRSVLVGLTVVSPACARTHALAKGSGPPDAGLPVVDAATAAVESSVDDPCAGPGDTSKRTDLTCADRKAWYARLGWPSDCEDAYTPIHGEAAIAFYEVGSARTLLGVECASGAYQGYGVYFLLSEGDASGPVATPLRFRTYKTAKGDAIEPDTVVDLWGTVTFDRARKELIVHRRFRGLGDCGIWARYSFSTGAPVVTEMRAHPACDLKEANPLRWPRIAPP
jgi:hypothetical protein